MTQCFFCGQMFERVSEHTCEAEEHYVLHVEKPLADLGIPYEGDPDLKDTFLEREKRPSNPWEMEEPNVGLDEMRESIRAERVADDGN